MRIHPPSLRQILHSSQLLSPTSLDKCPLVCQSRFQPFTVISAFHPATLTWVWSFALEDGVLPEEATEAGLLGAASFFSPRDLSKPFSGGEWAGLTRGVAGSYRVKRDRQRARLSKQTGGKPLAFTCRSNKLRPHVQTQINTLCMLILSLTHMHALLIHLSHPFLFVFFVLDSAWIAKGNSASKHTFKAHNQYYDRLFGNTAKGVEASTDKRELCLVSAKPLLWRMWLSGLNPHLTSLETSTTKSSLFSPSLSWNKEIPGSV